MDVVLNNVVKDVNFINKLNSELVAPEPTVYKDEETGEDIYDVPLKESLYYLGYQTKIHYITENINNNLALIKNIIYK